MEDRIIGPLTLQQFFYVLFGALGIYLLNSWLIGPFRILFFPLTLIIGTLSLALAFVKVQERPILFLFMAALRYLQRPRKRVWLKGQVKKKIFIVEKATPKVESAKKAPLDRQRVSDIVKVLEGPADGQK